MRLRLAILTICALALLAAPARADHGATVTDPLLARYMSIAGSYWGGPEPTCRTESGQLIHPHAVLADSPDPGVAAWAEVGGCRMWVDKDFWPGPPAERYCNLIAHEWGHLLGHEHSGDPNDLMWPEWTNIVVPGCQVFRPALRRHSAAWANRQRVKRLRRKRAAARRRTCASRARRGGRLRKRVVKRRLHRCLRRSVTRH